MELPRDDRTTEQKVFGVIPCHFGDTVRLMPTLKRKASREWKVSLSKQLGGTLADFDIKGDGGADSVGSVLGLGLVASDTIADLVLEYDRTGALGGSDWLDENADDGEIYVVFRSILAIHFPFAKDVLAMVGQLSGLMALGDQGVSTPDPSESTNSPSGPSPNGASPRTKSTSGSTTSK